MLGGDFMSRKGYFSILFQGICDNDGKHLSVFIREPGRARDARTLVEPDFFRDWPTRMGDFSAGEQYLHIGTVPLHNYPQEKQWKTY